MNVGNGRRRSLLKGKMEGGRGFFLLLKLKNSRKWWSAGLIKSRRFEICKVQENAGKDDTERVSFTHPSDIDLNPNRNWVRKCNNSEGRRKET